MKIHSRFTKVAVASGLIVMSGAAVLGLTSIASAQVGQQDAVVAVADAAGATSSTVTEGAVSASAVEGVAPEVTDTTVPGAVTPAAHADRPSPLVTVAKTLNMTEAELKAELVAGKSIADVAKAQNVDIDTVIAALTTEFKAHLAEEVTSGKHTQAEADAKLAEFKTRVTTMVNTAGLPQGKGGPGGHEGKGGPRGGKAASEAVATTLKLTPAELKTELQAGKSLAAIATAQNVDIADVKATITKEFTAHLAEEVASGEHTQAEADAKLAEFTTRLDDMVNNVRPAGGPQGHGKGGRGHGPMGGRGHGPMGGAPAAQGTSASA